MSQDEQTIQVNVRFTISQLKRIDRQIEFGNAKTRSDFCYQATLSFLEQKESLPTQNSLK